MPLQKLRKRMAMIMKVVNMTTHSVVHRDGGERETCNIEYLNLSEGKLVKGKNLPNISALSNLLNRYFSSIVSRRISTQQRFLRRQSVSKIWRVGAAPDLYRHLVVFGRVGGLPTW